MNVVDSSAWLSYFADDANAEIFAPPIEDTKNLLVPSITLTEVFKHIARNRNRSCALEIIAHMELGRVIPLTETLTISAAQYGIKHNLPLADSIIYATAQHYQATVWTQDVDFDGLDGVNYFQKHK